MNKNLLSLILALLTTALISGLVYSATKKEQSGFLVGGFGDTFLSIQVGTLPANVDVLQTDGTDSTWVTCATLTGSASLCDGDDATGAGGGAYPFTPTTSWGALAQATTSLLAFPQGLISSSTIGRATFGTITATSSTASTFVGLTVSGTLTGTLTGNADTATALAADGGNCSAGSFPLGVDTLGAVQSCTDAWTEAENTSAAYAAQATTITIAGTANQITSSAGAQDLIANRTWTLSIPSIFNFPNTFSSLT